MAFGVQADASGDLRTDERLKVEITLVFCDSAVVQRAVQQEVTRGFLSQNLCSAQGWLVVICRVGMKGLFRAVREERRIGSVT